MVSDLQKRFFFEAKESVLHEINKDMYGWDFSKMIEELKHAIENCGVPSKYNRVRFFSRHYLGMSGQKFRLVQGWTRGESVMSFNDITHVLSVLSKIRDGSIQMQTLETPIRSEIQIEEIPSETSSAKESPGAIRGFIEHTTTTLNSLMILAGELGVESNDLYDGDRIKMRIASKELFKSFGIEVVFPEPKAALSRPVTREDLEGLRLPTTTSKRRKKK